MDTTQILEAITSLAGVLAAILAWVAKIRWSNEFAKAKDETIKAKEALVEVKDTQLQTLIMNKDEVIRAKEEQITALKIENQSLKELTPMKVREYFLSVRQQIEEYNDLLKSQLEDAKQNIENKNTEIDNLMTEGSQKTQEIKQLVQERNQISEMVAPMQAEITKMRQKYESEDVIIYRLPRIDMSSIIQIDGLYKQLLEVQTKSISTHYSNLFTGILKSYGIMISDSKYFGATITSGKAIALETPDVSNDSTDTEHEDVKKDANDDSIVAG